MDKAPQTNVVGAFDNAKDAAAAVKGLHAAGFADAKIAVTPQADGAVVSVHADGRHAEATAQLERNGSSGVQNVAR
jgi:hypothetical protein